MNRFFLCVVLLFGLVVTACSETTGDAAGGIKISMNVEHSDNNGVVKYLAFGRVEEGGAAVTDAIVKVGSVTIPYDGAITKQYYAELEPTDFTPGTTLTVTVETGGVIYTQSLVMPGGIDASGISITWTFEGDHDWLAVALEADPGNPVYDTYQGIGTSGSGVSDIDSPHEVSWTVYPIEVWCLLHIVVKNQLTGAFPGADPASALVCSDILTVRRYRENPM